MPVTLKNGRQEIEIDGVALDLTVLGEGQPLLFLHSGIGSDFPADPCLSALGRDFRVIAPWHPGFGLRERPQSFRDVNDLAYLYLDLVEELGFDRLVLAGASFGGWIAAEMAVRSTAGLSHLVLVDPFGIKAGGITDRDIADLFAITPAQFEELAYADRARAKRDLAALDDAELAAHFRAHESLAFYGWKPYMHDPQLRRWLHRIRIPTLLLAGRQDRVVAPGYHQAYSSAFRDCRLRIIEGAGHFPHIEKPGEVAGIIADFCAARAG